jgi:hypothetical protein
VSAHTPGPWAARGPFNETIGTLQEPSFEISSPDVSVAFVFYPRKDVEAREAARADARLIASAPDLLGACEALVAGVEDAVLRFLDSHEKSLRPDMDQLLRARVDRARAAIAKARGK